MDIIQRFNDMEQYHIVNNIHKYMKHDEYTYIWLHDEYTYYKEMVT